MTRKRTEMRRRVTPLSRAFHMQRWEEGLTLREAAEEIGVTHDVVARLEQGTRPKEPSLSLILSWLNSTERVMSIEANEARREAMSA